MTLSFSGLKVFTDEEGLDPPGHIAVVLLNRKLKLPPGHFGLIISVSILVKRRLLFWLGFLILSQEEIWFLQINNIEEDVCKVEDPLG